MITVGDFSVVTTTRNALPHGLSERHGRGDRLLQMAIGELGFFPLGKGHIEGRDHRLFDLGPGKAVGSLDMACQVEVAVVAMMLGQVDGQDVGPLLGRRQIDKEDFVEASRRPESRYPNRRRRREPRKALFRSRRSRGCREPPLQPSSEPCACSLPTAPPGCRRPCPGRISAAASSIRQRRNRSPEVVFRQSGMAVSNS